MGAITEAARWLGEHPGDDALAGATPFLEMLGLTVGWMGLWHGRGTPLVDAKRPNHSKQISGGPSGSPAGSISTRSFPTAPALLPAVTSGASALG